MRSRLGRARLLAAFAPLALALSLLPVASAGAAGPLSWSPPPLSSPVVLHPTVAGADVNMDPARDYVIDLGSTPLRGGGGLVLQGGRNVVLIGGEIDVPAQTAPAGAQYPTIESRRGLFLRDQTGTVHVEGLHITGSGLSEGIDLQEGKGAIVQLENVRVEAIRALDEVGFTDNHPDIVQTWAGPAELRIDGLTGTTDFQGLMLNPTDIGPFPARAITLRRINFRSLPSADKLYNKSGSDPMSYRDLWWEAPPDPPTTIWCHVWPCSGTWTDVGEGVPPGGDYVPAGAAGIGYTSPGYADVPATATPPSTGTPPTAGTPPPATSTPAAPAAGAGPGKGRVSPASRRTCTRLRNGRRRCLTAAQRAAVRRRAARRHRRAKHQRRAKHHRLARHHRRAKHHRRGSIRRSSGLRRRHPSA